VAIRFKDQPSLLGQVTAALGNATSAFTGTFTPAASRTGVIASSLQSATSQITGIFSSAPNRTGTIGATLQSATASIVGTSAPPAAQWQAFSGPTFIQGTPTTWSYAAFAPVGATDFQIDPANTALPSGVTNSSAAKQLVWSGSGTNGTTTQHRLEDIQTAEADWLLRSGQNVSSPQPGVVWFHDFRTAAEVNQFRWTGGYSGGNDPLAVGANSQAPFPGNTRQIMSDGIAGTGGGCLEIIRHVGSGGDTSEFWRPFSALRSPGNGRASHDPAAGGTIALKTWAPSDGSTTTRFWSGGFYGHVDYHAGDPGQFDGTEWWLQARIKMDPNRAAANNPQTGKLFYFTRTDLSLTSQEIVTESLERIGTDNYFSMYRSGSPPLEQDSPGISTHGNQPGTEYGTVGNLVCRFDNNGGRLANCWKWPAGQWCTLMYHIRAGHDGSADTLIEVWVQEVPGTAPIRIWNQPNTPLPFAVHMGHNALIISGYMNQLSVGTQFYHRVTQLIFSKQTIPWPQV
jgi:hypothetical protein